VRPLPREALALELLLRERLLLEPLLEERVFRRAEPERFEALEAERVERLFACEPPARRERVGLEPERDLEPPACRPCGCFSSPPLPSVSSFFATVTAAGTATPIAAPATTFFPVDIPSCSFSSIV